MSYLAGTPIRTYEDGRGVTTIHINQENYKQFMHLLKTNRYNFSHFMDNLISILLKNKQILDIILEEK